MTAASGHAFRARLPKTPGTEDASDGQGHPTVVHVESVPGEGGTLSLKRIDETAPDGGQRCREQGGPLALAAGRKPAVSNHQRSEGRETFSAVGGFARRVCSALSRLRHPQPLAGASLTQDPRAAPLVIHIDGFLTVEESARLRRTDRSARKILGAMTPEGARVRFRQQLAALNRRSQATNELPRGFFSNARAKAQKLVSGEFGRLVPKLLRQEYVCLNESDAGDRAAQVEDNRRAFQDALAGQGCALPAGSPLPRLSESHNDIERMSTIDTGSIRIERSGERHVRVTVAARSNFGNEIVGADVYTLNAESLEHFAALLGSSVANVVAWMATFPPAELVRMIGHSAFTALPISYEHRYNERATSAG
ncbi:MAG TPA: hypothetical protein VHA82_14760 [Ramlibacter sp.]|uniref:hypothetical protein n=1 Tax=Ramlibacter sp. TaxID=1917967 RepID=UPI002B5388C5|nr:hypothetical protein [Ramlibacter sp.]HVZ45069.1 hypothetical protein [Ramlibacter sp.]